MAENKWVPFFIETNMGGEIKINSKRDWFKFVVFWAKK